MIKEKKLAATFFHTRGRSGEVRTGGWCIRRNVFLLAFCFLFSSATFSQNILPPFYNKQAEQYADSVIKLLSPEERIAQLIMISAWSNQDSTHIKKVQQTIYEYGIGGLVFFQGGPVREALLTNDYQKLSKVPLLIGMDAEWGPAMRLDSTIRFPRQMTLSAMHNDSLLNAVSEEIARQCKRLGIHVNFAPVADINNNPLNPVIGSRAFSDDRETVARDAMIYMEALQRNHILPTAKHFPGHGDVDADSHFTLPVLSQSKNEMDSVELYPFRQLINNGLGGMMVAHLNVPCFDTIPGLPSTLSVKIVKEMLIEQMGFKGIIFTDALNMNGVTQCYKPGILDKLALLAGNDVLLLSEDVCRAMEEIHLSVENCEIKQEEIDARTKKILMLKHWVGLNKLTPVDTAHLYEDLNSPAALNLQRTLYKSALTLLSNKNSAVPVTYRDSLKIASVVIGDVKENAFQKQLSMYAAVDNYALEKDAPEQLFEAMKNFLTNYDLVIVSMHNTSMNAAKNYGVSTSAQKFIDSVITKYKTIFVDFGNAYTLSRFTALDKAAAVLLAYEDFPLVHSLAAQILFGGISSKGILPVTIQNNLFAKGAGEKTGEPIRFEYCLPEEVGINSRDLSEIDSIVFAAIAQGAMPGCQVLIAKDKKVIYQKSFGTHTHTVTTKVSNDDLYDIASVTKIVATAPATMLLYDRKKIGITQPVSKYLLQLKNTNKKNIIIKDVMAHQAGLVSWIPFWKQTMKQQMISGDIYHKTQSEKYFSRVADSIYIRNDYRDSIMKWIYNSPLGERGKYIYSDLGPMLMKEVVEKISSTTLDEFVSKEFYKPLGLSHLSFYPRKKFDLKKIIPTEDDFDFRGQLLIGDVHDPAAAMLGGVSGNAGVFANANDVAVIMQMYLNTGMYGGRRFLSPETIFTFTSQQFPLYKNRRGLFFDKPEPDTTKASPVCKSASLKTFGHQGFTGTYAWADPEHNLVYVFLSNRVNPDANNEKLMKMNVRTRIQQVIYDAMK